MSGVTLCRRQLPMPWMAGADLVLVGIAGRAGSGKSAAAEYLCRAYDFEPVAFAGAIKDLLADLLTSRGAEYAHLHEPALKTRPIAQMAGLSARQLMQSLGDWGRSLHPDWWVQQLAHHIGMAEAPALRTPVHDRIVVSDVRYDNEAHWIIDQGGVIIRLHRDQAGPAEAHSSEQCVDGLPVHVDLVNNGPTLAGLHALLDGVMDSIGCFAWSRAT